MQSIVVDASVSLKWIIDEAGTSDALALLDRGAIHAPDFLLVEVANVLWSKVRRQVIPRPQADAGYEAIAAVPMFLVPVGELTAPARSVAFALDLTVYDAIYAALAQRLDCPLATADRALAAAIEAAGTPGSAMLIR